MRLPRIAFTMGDPAGIGPEIILRMLEAHPEFARQAELLIYGIPEVIENARQRFCRKELPAFTMVQATDVEVEHFADGVLDPADGLAAYQMVAAAAGDALDGKIDAMVTAPVNKAAVNLNGIHFTGHTELVAEICAARDFAMMQSAGDLRIAFVPPPYHTGEGSGGMHVRADRPGRHPAPRCGRRRRHCLPQNRRRRHQSACR